MTDPTPRQRQLARMRKLAAMRSLAGLDTSPVVAERNTLAVDPTRPAGDHTPDRLPFPLAMTGVALANALSPILPRAADKATSDLLDRTDVSTPLRQNLAGVFGAGGAVGGNVALNAVLPGGGEVVAAKSLPQLAGAVGRTALTQGATGYGLGAGGTLLEGGTLAEANRSGLELGIPQAVFGGALRGIVGARAQPELFGPLGENVTDFVKRIAGRVGNQAARLTEAAGVLQPEAQSLRPKFNSPLTEYQMRQETGGYISPELEAQVKAHEDAVTAAEQAYAREQAVTRGEAPVQPITPAPEVRGPNAQHEAIAESRAMTRAPKVSAERQAFRDAPPPVLAVDPNEYVNLSKMGLDDQATARLSQEVERIGPQVQGNPRRQASWEEWKDAAQSLGLSDVTRGDFRSMDAPVLLANRNLIARNTDQLIAIDHALSNPALSLEERNALTLRGQALDAQNDILLRRFMQGRTESGRRLNSLKIVANRTLDPAWWLSKGTDIAGRSLTDAEQAMIRQRIHVGDKAGLVDLLAGLRQSGAGEKLLTYWKANLLTNPTTHSVNLGANTVLATLETTKDIPGSAYDALLGRVTGNRTLTHPTLQQMRAGAEGAVEGIHQMRNVLRGVRTAEELARYDIPRDVNFDSPVLDGYTKFVFRTLGAEDRVYRYAAMQRSLQNQAEVLARTEGLTGFEAGVRAQILRDHPTPEMALRAVGDAEQATVNDATQLGRMLGSIHNFAPGGVPIGGFAVPFARTPGAVATRVGEYTLGLPIGVTQIAVKAAKGELQGMPPEAQRELAKLLGRGTTGAGIIAAGALLAKYGLLTPPAPDALTDRSDAQTQQAIGEQGSSFVLGNTQLEVGRLSPAGNLLMVGALAHKAAADHDPSTSPLAEGAVGAIRTVTDQPFLQGIDQIREAVQGKGNAVQRFGGGLLRGMVPGAAGLSALGRVLDPIVRRQPTMLSQVQASIPGLSQGLEPRIGPLGEPQMREPGVTGALSQLLTPGRILTRKTDPVSQAIRETGLTVGAFQRKPNESEPDFTARSIRMGQQREAKLRQVIVSDAYTQADVEGRKELLEAALRSAASEAAAETRRLSPRQRKLREMRQR